MCSRTADEKQTVDRPVASKCASVAATSCSRESALRSPTKGREGPEVASESIAGPAAAEGPGEPSPEPPAAAGGAPAEPSLPPAASGAGRDTPSAQASSKLTSDADAASP